MDWHCACGELPGKSEADMCNSCALLDIHRPDLIDYDSLDKKSASPTSSTWRMCVMLPSPMSGR
jgi:hypothetical protein